MPRSVAPLFRALTIAALLASPFALIVACGSESGVTPTCVSDVTEAGIKPGVDGGCTGFAICEENPSKPATCCKTADGTKFTGTELSDCLFAYGAGPAPSTAAATTGSGSGSTSSSSSTGGQ